jgi:hypothetical protein
MRNAALILGLMGLLACGAENQSMMTEEVGDEIRKRDIRRISDGEVMERAFNVGMMIADSAQKKLQSQLLAAIGKGGVEYAIDFCHVSATQIMQELSLNFKADIRRVSNRWRNPADAPDDFEAPILDAYEYNMENELPMEENVQKLGDEILVYTRPIMLASPLCLNCHGQAGTEVAATALEAINARYPNDKAINHEQGDLRGIWSIRLKKRDLVLLD